jgi:hypothetical protein
MNKKNIFEKKTMKKIYLFTILICGFSFGQIQTPQPSPFSKIEQVVGLTDVTINYSPTCPTQQSNYG